MRRPTANGYFSGVGGMELGLQQAGIELLQSVELDLKATECMRANAHYFSHNIVTGDVKTMCVNEQPAADIFIGTYPCDKYSTIADIHGTRTGDDLYLHFFRMLAIRQPEMYILENVPGMMKFKVVMEAMSKLPGYYINIFCPLDAAIWLPQRRKRLILFGTRKPFQISPPSVLTKPMPMSSIIEPNADIKIPG
jgi:DNA (cytosine-5)-methyltransferase 1